MSNKIDIEEANRIALDDAKEQLGGSNSPEVAINERFVTPCDGGWVIFWNTKEFLATGDIMKAVAPGLGRTGVTWTGEILNLPSGINEEECCDLITKKNNVFPT